MHGELFLSRVINDNDVAALKRYNITAADFATPGERQALKFIEQYVEQNRGNAPSMEVVAGECAEFSPMPVVEDSYDYLVGKIKDDAAKRAVKELIEGKLAQSFNGGEGGINLAKLLRDASDDIIMRTDVRKSIGRTLAEIKDTFREEYVKREQGKSSKRWDTPFAPLTQEISGWFSGDIYGVMGESGRGKSYLMACIIDSLLRQGANVLWKSFEVKEYVSIARLVSIATAVDELLLDELGRKVGIHNRAILSGKLEDVVRDQFFAVIDVLDEYYAGNLYFQGKSSAELTRTLDDLERELSTGLVDAVILDPFYGLTDVYGKNANKTSGGAAEQAATRFENIIGDFDVLGFYTVQATVEKKQTDEDGVRELNLPTRDQVKTSKRLLDIATNLLGFDSVEKEGIAMLGIEKGRNGGEDFRLELMALFNYGVLREFPTGEAAASQFNF